MDNSFENVDEYIFSSPVEVRERLIAIRKTILELVPEAIESISYAMPAYKLNGKPLVYFAAFHHHIGFYATPAVHESFAKELSMYKQGKGSVQFPLNQPLPIGLITQMTTFKAETIRSKAKK